MALTPKQQRFVEAYLIDPNAAAAARAAGSSAKNSQQAGYEFLTNPDVRAAIDAANEKRAKANNITAERVLAEIANMAFYDPAEIMREIGEEDGDDDDRYRYSDDGKIYGLRGPGDIRALPESVRRAITGWSWDKAGNFTVKLADKGKALDQLARHLSLYNDKLEVTGVDALADRLMRASERNG